MSLSSLILCLLALCSSSKAQLFDDTPTQQIESDENNFIIPIPNGYLPPVPDQPVCMPTPVFRTETSTAVETTIEYSQPIGSQLTASISFVTKVVPTTIITKDVVTSYSTIVEATTLTDTQIISSTFVKTIDGSTSTTTLFSTQIVPTTLYSTLTATDTSLDYVTSTSIERSVTTLLSSLLVTNTEEEAVVRTVSVQGEDIVETRIATTTLFSSVVATLPPSVDVRATTLVTTLTQTSFAEPTLIYVTKTFTSVVPVQATKVSVIREYTTDTQIVTSTLVRFFTELNTRVITDTATRNIEQTRFTTQSETEFTTKTIPITVTERSVIYSTRQSPDETSTAVSQIFETKTLEREVDLLTETAYSTVFSTSTVTIYRDYDPSVVSITVTERESCEKTGYRYDEPTIAFNF